MRALAAAKPVVAAALLAAADDGQLTPTVEAIVQAPPTEHQRLARAIITSSRAP